MTNTRTVSLNSGKMLLNINRVQEGFSLDSLCGFACRKNPKRSFLFVSKVLGKHYPVLPSVAQNVNKVLASKVLEADVKNNALFIGFAETATGLGNGVYDEWVLKANATNSVFLHTTRYKVSGPVLFNFEEEHSHATGHILYRPAHDTSAITSLVLIDDELTTGKTMANFISEFIPLFPNIRNIVVVGIKNWMGDLLISQFKHKFPKVSVSFLSLLEGEYSYIQNTDYVPEPMPNVDGNFGIKDNLLKKNFGRKGISGRSKLEVDPLSLNLDLSKKTLVLGTGEFHYQPLLLAAWMENQGCEVAYQSTTRSPIALGHDIAKKLEFTDNYGDNIPNYVYNVGVGDYDQIVLCAETEVGSAPYLGENLPIVPIYF